MRRRWSIDLCLRLELEDCILRGREHEERCAIEIAMGAFGGQRQCAESK